MEALVMDSVRVVGDLHKVSLKDGDTVVLMANQFFTPSQREVVNKYLSDAFPNNTVLIADGGIKIGVLGDDDRIDRIEKRLDSIAELIAVLLDSVQQEDEQEPSIDLDGEVIERVKHEQDWL
jgi:hypothetical protein